MDHSTSAPVRRRHRDPEPPWGWEKATPELTPEQRSKLPKWALEHIDTLARTIERREEHIYAHVRKNPPTLICADPYQHKVWLPSGETVRFFLDNIEGATSDMDRPYVDVRLLRDAGPDERRAIELRAGGARSHSLHLKPVSGNVAQATAAGPYMVGDRG